MKKSKLIKTLIGSGALLCTTSLVATACSTISPSNEYAKYGPNPTNRIIDINSIKWVKSVVFNSNVQSDIVNKVKQDNVTIFNVYAGLADAVTITADVSALPTIAVTIKLDPSYTGGKFIQSGSDITWNATYNAPTKVITIDTSHLPAAIAADNVEHEYEISATIGATSVDLSQCEVVVTSSNPSAMTARWNSDNKKVAIKPINTAIVNLNIVINNAPLSASGSTTAQILVKEAQVEALTYLQLKELRDNGNLIEGQQYRINDFVTTTNGKVPGETSGSIVENGGDSAGHQFDVVVVATSRNTLSENATVKIHEDDEYFASNNLDAWQIKYCLDNNTNRFQWADDSVTNDVPNGKGVIYWMKDEFNNECSYDFKNIRFKRKTKGGSDVDNNFHFTFSNHASDQTKEADLSLAVSNFVHDNVIKPNQIHNGSYYTLQLNRINFFGKRIYSNTVGNFSFTCYFFNGDADNMTCRSNNIGDSLFNCTFESGFSYNTINAHVTNSTFNKNITHSTIGTSNSSLSIGSNVENFSTGEGCSNIIVVDQTVNTFALNTVSGKCEYLTFNNVNFTNNTIINTSGVSGTPFVFDKNKENATFINGVEQPQAVVSIQYSDLKTIHDAGELVPGQQYRIIDYETTVNNATSSDPYYGKAKAAGHQFDLIVTAETASTLSEDAKAVKHVYASGEVDPGYFDEHDTLFSAWEIKYCFNNQTGRFDWADKTNGKGVIYYMKDEFGNEAPYDFKNIQFTPYGTDYADGHYCYTFASHYADGNTDRSLSHNFQVHNNKIPTYEVDGIRKLNRICFIGENGTDKMLSNTYSNEFGENNHDITLGNTCYDNTFDSNDFNITLKNGCQDNTFDNLVRNITIGSNFMFNLIGNDIWDSSFGDNCRSNNIGNSSGVTNFGNGCWNNTLGSNSTNNTLGENCSSNSFGNACSWNTLATGCNSNSFANGCIGNKLGIKCYLNTFDNDCMDNNLINTIDNSFQNRNHFSTGCKNITVQDQIQCENNEFMNNISYLNIMAAVTGSTFMATPGGNDHEIYDVNVALTNKVIMNGKPYGETTDSYHVCTQLQWFDASGNKTVPKKGVSTTAKLTLLNWLAPGTTNVSWTLENTRTWATIDSGNSTITVTPTSEETLNFQVNATYNGQTYSLTYSFKPVS